jgi:hypothetical protein
VLLHHEGALADGQSDPWAMLDGAGEDVLGLGETVARVEQALDRHAVARPLLDLVEVAVIRIERVARFLIRPVAHGREYPGQWGGRSSLLPWASR